MNRDQTIAQLPAAIRRVRSKIRWKPDSAVRHLLKRKLRGHLPADATLDDYDRIIYTVLTTDTAHVYLYWHGHDAYPTIVTVLEGNHWLVIFSMDGILESAFVVKNPESYLRPPNFEPMGLLYEVLA
jgi:hypothetical protein